LRLGTRAAELGFGAITPEQLWGRCSPVWTNWRGAWGNLVHCDDAAAAHAAAVARTELRAGRQRGRCTG